jgi:hypothetical protein
MVEVDPRDGVMLTYHAQRTRHSSQVRLKENYPARRRLLCPRPMDLWGRQVRRAGKGFPGSFAGEAEKGPNHHNTVPREQLYHGTYGLERWHVSAVVVVLNGDLSIPFPCTCTVTGAWCYCTLLATSLVHQHHKGRKLPHSKTSSRS